MPYCTTCGTQVLGADRFCPRCGKAQPPGTTPAAGAAETGAPPPGSAPPPPPPSGTPVQPPPYPSEPPVGGAMRPSTAATLCYIPLVGWIAAIIFLMLDPYRTNRYVRFHAFQGLYLAVVWFVAQMLFFPLDLHPRHLHAFPFFPLWSIRELIKVAVLIAQIVGIVRVHKNQPYRLPIIGELAEKSMA